MYWTNEIKAQGTHMFGVGIGGINDTVTSQNNLKDVNGFDKYNDGTIGVSNADVFFRDFEDFTMALETFVE